ncbi:MAG: hypothetical protein K8F36_14285 [Melioribacteraceae bacterium]|nr:hypothetical protein [Melioribacteraceae bacterium]
MKKYFALFFLISITVNAHKEWVHQYVVEQAYLYIEAKLDILPQEFKEMFLYNNGNFPPYERPSHNTIYGVHGGAWMEDDYDPIYQYCGWEYPIFDWILNCPYSSNSHFWKPDLSDPFHTYGLEFVSGTYHNAYEKCGKYWYGDEQMIFLGPLFFESNTPEGTLLYNNGYSPTTSYDLIIIRYNKLANMYKNGNYFIDGVLATGSNSITWFNNPIEIFDGQFIGVNSVFARTLAGNILGRICHLIADMNIPAHVKEKSHPCPLAYGSF